MHSEQDVIKAYVKGSYQVQQDLEKGGSAEACFFLLPMAVARVRKVQVAPGYETLTLQEQFAVGLLYKIIMNERRYVTDYPRLLGNVAILEIEVPELRSEPLVRSRFLKRYSRRAQVRHDTVLEVAASLVAQVVQQDIPIADADVAPARPGIVIYRKPREIGDEWLSAKSWLGGAPRLGGQAWPRDSQGQPIQFAAQLDLRELREQSGATDFPDDGALAFFVGREGAVMHVHPGEGEMFTIPPVDLPPVEDAGMDKPGNGVPLPFWPVGFMGLEDNPDRSVDERYAAQGEMIAARFEQREYNLTCREVLGGPAIPRWWQTAVHYANMLSEKHAEVPKAIEREQQMLDWINDVLANPEKHKDENVQNPEQHRERIEGNIATIKRQAPELDEFIAEIKAWCHDKDPWEIMSDAEWKQLGAYWQRIADFPLITGYHGCSDFNYSLPREMFKVLPTSGDATFQELPEGVRSIIEARRAPRPQWWHSAHLYLEKLNETAAKNAADENAATFEMFRNEVEGWCVGRDSWSQMSPQDVEKFDGFFQRGKSEFDQLLRYVFHNWLEDETLRLVLAGTDDVYKTIPEMARKTVNAQYLLPVGPCHQMFGVPISIQDHAILENYDRELLLQLSYDDVMFWSFGDCGVFQFWISAEELKDGNWAAANLTFECS